MAPLALSRAFAPVLARQGGGAIINVPSVLSWLNTRGLYGYRHDSRRQRAEDTTRGGGAPGPVRTSPTNVGDNDEAKGVSRIQWDDSRTERIIEWLEENAEDRQRLFSDSSQNARKENRAQRVAKGSKSVYYSRIAQYVFSVDPDPAVRMDLDTEPQKFSKAVENRIAA